MFFNELADEIKEVIWEGLKKDLVSEAKAQGYNPKKVEEMDEFIDDYINCNNTEKNVREWVNIYYL